MIKLRLSFEVSLSTIILGVAGISATVCAFQFFTSKNKKPKGCLQYVLQNLKGSKKDNKLSNLVSAKPTVKLKLSKNKSVKDDLKTSMPDNCLDIYSNKSKSCITQRKKEFKNVSDCNKDIQTLKG